MLRYGDRSEGSLDFVNFALFFSSVASNSQFWSDGWICRTIYSGSRTRHYIKEDWVLVLLTWFIFPCSNSWYFPMLSSILSYSHVSLSCYHFTPVFHAPCSFVSYCHVSIRPYSHTAVSSTPTPVKTHWMQTSILKLLWNSLSWTETRKRQFKFTRYWNSWVCSDTLKPLELQTE